MKKSIKYLFVLVFSAVTLSGIANPPGNDSNKAVLQISDTLSFNEYQGKIVDAQTGEPLSFATIAVEGENTATVSNSEGGFILKKSTRIAKPKILWYPTLVIKTSFFP
ncbi:MAG: carboxypeptidase-like regulatory domain-containing protein [Chlorobi bacterium]|nr:carboxypeptidase-like regulatory domain-containing protein [Chlorobiota bacterium]